MVAVSSPQGRGGRGVGKGQAHFIATTPLDVGADRLFLVGNVKLDNVGKIRPSREYDARALIGNIANEAIDGAAALVEIDATSSCVPSDAVRPCSGSSTR